MAGANIRVKPSGEVIAESAAPFAWNTVTSFFNNWSDAQLLYGWQGGISQAPPPVQWGKTGDGIILVRGTLSPGEDSWGRPAFFIPPPDSAGDYSQRFVCAGLNWGDQLSVIHDSVERYYAHEYFIDVNLSAVGGVVPQRPRYKGFTPYFGSPFFNATSGSVGPYLTGSSNWADQYLYQFHNNLSELIEYYGIGAFGFKSGGSPLFPGPTMCLNVDAGPFADTQVSVTNVAATAIGLSVRARLPYLAGSFALPVGYSCVVPTTAGGNSYIWKELLVGGSVDISAGGHQPSPGFAAGDVLTMTAIGDQLACYKNNDPTPFLEAYDGQYRQGNIGLGFNGATGTALIEDVKWGAPEDLKSAIVALDNIVYRTEL